MFIYTCYELSPVELELVIWVGVALSDWAMRCTKWVMQGWLDKPWDQ